MQNYKIELHNDDEVIYFDLPNECSVDNDMIIGGYKLCYNHLVDYLEDCGAINIRYEYVERYDNVTITRTVWLIVSKGI